MAHKRSVMLKATNRLLDRVMASDQMSQSAQDISGRKVNVDNISVHNIRTLLDDLVTDSKNRTVSGLPGMDPFETLV